MNKLLVSAILASMVAGVSVYAKAKTDKRQPSSGIEGTVTAQGGDEQFFLMINGDAAAQMEHQLKTMGHPQQIKFGVRCFNKDDVSMQVLHDANEPMRAPGLHGEASHCVISKFLGGSNE